MYTHWFIEKKRAYTYTYPFTRRKECICWKIKEIQEETITGVNTMVLAHNIEWSNDYLIPSKNTTSSKCCFGLRYWERLKLYKEEKIKGLSGEVMNILWSVRSNENMHVKGFWCFAWSRLSMCLSFWWWMRSNDWSGS